MKKRIAAGDDPLIEETLFPFLAVRYSGVQ